MIKTKENQSRCASNINLKEKECTLKASSIQRFCLNLHFESTATAMTALPPTAYYIGKNKFLQSDDITPSVNTL